MVFRSDRRILFHWKMKLLGFSLENFAAWLKEAKQKGYADRQIAHVLNCLESHVFDKREALGIKRIYKIVDTCAAEFEAKTPYYYSTFDQENESISSEKGKNNCFRFRTKSHWTRIEFDYSCVHGVLAAKVVMRL